MNKSEILKIKDVGVFEISPNFKRKSKIFKKYCVKHRKIGLLNMKTGGRE